MSSQASSTDISELSSAQFNAELSFSFHDSQELGSPLELTKARKRSCYVWDHMPSEDRDFKYYSSKTKKPEWRCKYCSKTYALNGGTAIIKTHLLDKHQIQNTTPRATTAQKRQLSMEEAVANGERHPRLRRRLQLLP
jgi:hypothetical protein